MKKTALKNLLKLHSSDSCEHLHHVIAICICEIKLLMCFQYPPAFQDGYLYNCSLLPLWEMKLTAYPHCSKASLIDEGMKLAELCRSVMNQNQVPTAFAKAN